MSSRMFSLLPEGLSPGRLIGLLLGIVQSSLMTLLPTDFTMSFWLLILLILLLYLLVPLVARLYTRRQQAQTPGERKIARHIGLTCAALATITPTLVYVLATSGKPAVPSGGLFVPDLIVDKVASLVLLLLLNAIGLILALIGGKLGGMFGALRARSLKEQPQ